MSCKFYFYRKYLNATGRPIVYSCSWPDYQQSEGMPPNYKMIAEHCNLWRNFDDIDDSWESVVSIMDYYGGKSLIRLNNPACSKSKIFRLLGKTSDEFAPIAGPGNWNVRFRFEIFVLYVSIFISFQDPDMLIIGNFGLSLDQAKVQMAVVSIFKTSPIYLCTL